MTADEVARTAGVAASARRVLGAAVAGLLALVAGCGSSTDPSAPPTEAPGAPTTTVVEPLADPVRVTDWPAAGAVDAAVVSGTTAWVLMAGPNGTSSIWRFPAGGGGTEVVVAEELNELYPPTVSMASWPNGLIVTGMRCDEPMVGDCVKDSGIVQLRDLEGKPSKQIVLWHDEQTQAGGSAPRFVGHDDTNAWFRTPDDLVAVDGSGEIVTRVPVTGPGDFCAVDGALYRVRVDSPPIPDEITAESTEKLEPATVSVQRFIDSKWTPVDNGVFTASGPYPEAKCQGNSIGLWTDRVPEATWTAERGWIDVPDPSEPLSDTDISGQTSPSIADNGAVYRLGDDFHLRRLDLTTGTLVDTGLVLEPTTTNTKSFIWVTVAESGETLFACAGRADGMPDGPTNSGTVCGFAPVPS